MWPTNVGIVAMETYFPRLYVEQKELEEMDGCSGKYTQGLGQHRMGFCTDREDISSVCLTVLHNLIDHHKIDLKNIGYLEVGTETIIDKSKSTKTVLMQLFEASGNHDMAGVDCKNACFGGTAALFNAVNWVESSAWDGRLALVVMADIAIYATKAARPTGGAGALAILVGPNAPLVFDRGVRSHYMSHSYDFYKPDMHSEYPTVDGPLSINCYLSALDACYAAYKEKARKKGLPLNGTLTVSTGIDYMCFHSPFAKLVQKSFGRLVYLDLRDNPDLAGNPVFDPLVPFGDLPMEKTLSNRELETACLTASKDLFLDKVDPSMMMARNVGNMYTASLYSCLISLLHNTPTERLCNRRILLFSYGSGLTSCMYSLHVTSDRSLLQPFLEQLGAISDRLESRVKVPPETFLKLLQEREATHNKAPYTPSGCVEDLFPGTYYLSSVDDKFRRTYKRYL